MNGSASKVSTIRKVPGKNKWRVLSKKGKNLGEYGSKEKAEKRLQQVEMFKHMKGKKRKSSEPLEMFCLACGDSCPLCGGTVTYDDSRDAYVCLECGWAGPNGPSERMAAIASHIASPINPEIRLDASGAEMVQSLIKQSPRPNEAMLSLFRNR